MNGFAVKDIERNEILIKTVSDTARAAMVNWLATEAKVTVWADWSDAKIENAFSIYAWRMRVTVVPVEVREAPKS